MKEQAVLVRGIPLQIIAEIDKKRKMVGLSRTAYIRAMLGAILKLEAN